MEKDAPKIGLLYVIKKTAQRKQSPNVQKIAHSGHPELKHVFCATL
jgi:hypothetical protein